MQQLWHCFSANYQSFHRAGEAGKTLYLLHAEQQWNKTETVFNCLPFLVVYPCSSAASGQ
jgi:hypothetical protein